MVPPDESLTPTLQQLRRFFKQWVQNIRTYRRLVASGDKAKQSILQYSERMAATFCRLGADEIELALASATPEEALEAIRRRRVCLERAGSSSSDTAAPGPAASARIQDGVEFQVSKAAASGDTTGFIPERLLVHSLLINGRVSLPATCRDRPTDDLPPQVRRLLLKFDAISLSDLHGRKIVDLLNGRYGLSGSKLLKLLDRVLALLNSESTSSRRRPISQLNGAREPQATRKMPTVDTRSLGVEAAPASGGSHRKSRPQLGSEVSENPSELRRHLDRLKIELSRFFKGKAEGIESTQQLSRVFIEKVLQQGSDRFGPTVWEETLTEASATSKQLTAFRSARVLLGQPMSAGVDSIQDTGQALEIAWAIVSGTDLQSLIPAKAAVRTKRPSCPPAETVACTENEPQQQPLLASIGTSESWLDDGKRVLAAIALHVARRAIRLPSPFSIAELQMTSEDCEWLRSWATTVTPNLVGQLSRNCRVRWKDQSLPSFRLSELFGLAFLVLATEVARRDAGEDFIWPCLRSCFPEQTASPLFGRGQPTRLLRDSIEAAARRMKLRNVFGREGTQEWFLSFKLQFGFTRRGINRLPLWLSGQAQTEAVQLLLRPPEDGGSESFQRLWEALRHYRRGNITKAQCEETLRASSWVLQDWSDEIISAARARMELETDLPAEQRETLADVFSEVKPRLVWTPPGKPEFYLDLEELAGLEAPDDTYSLLANGESLTQLIRDSGRWQDLSGHDRIKLPSAPSIKLELVSTDSESAYPFQIELWDGSDDITVYRLETGAKGGTQVSAESVLNPGTAYALITARDLNVQPEPRWATVGTGASARKLWLLTASWSPAISLCRDETVIWQPRVRDTTKSAEPTWAQDIQLDVDGEAAFRPIRVGRDDVQFQISGVPSGVEVTFVRVGGTPLTFRRIGSSRVRTEQFRITAEVVARALTATVGLKRGTEQTRVRRRLVLNLEGWAMLTEGGWEAGSQQDSVTVQSALHQMCRIFLPDDQRSEGAVSHDLALMEGDAFLRRVTRRPFRIAKLSGFGQSLELRYGPYNQPADSPRIVLAKQVVDTGCLASVQTSEDGKHLELRLSSAIEPSAAHTVVTWSPPELPQVFTISKTSGDGKTSPWRIEIPDGSPLAVGIAFEGRRIGAWWNNALGTALEAFTTGDRVRSTAMMVRWLRLPIANSAFRRPLQNLLKAYADQVLPAWLLEASQLTDGKPITSGFPVGLLLDASTMDEAWFSALRTITADFRADDADVARALLRALGGGQSDDALVDGLVSLLSLDPLLMAQIAKAWVAGNGVESVGHTPADFLSQLAEHVGSDEVETLAQAASAMQVDENFIRGLGDAAADVLRGKTMRDFQRSNLMICLNVAPVRCYLATRLVKELERSCLCPAGRR